MKKSILTIVLAIMTTLVCATGTPDSSKTIITHDSFEMSVMELEQKAFFEIAAYNNAQDALEFVTKEKIAYIQIVKDNQLEYQLPVMSNKLKIGRALFGKGIYKIGFITEGGKKIEFTQLEVHK